MTIATGRQLTARTDQTSLRLFFRLLHKARELKQSRRNPIIRRAYLMGMLKVYIDDGEDFRIADSQRDYWKHTKSGERI